MARIPADLLQKIKDSVNLIEVVGEHVVLKKSGSNYSGLCPFHSERSPSFSVSETKQVYHCYGCKAGGDVVTFITQMHGLSFIEGVQELAERGKVPIPAGILGSDEDAKDPEAAQRKQEEREKLALASRLNRFVAAFYRKQLESGLHAEARKYLESRGVTPEWEQNFYVGGAHASWDSLAKQLGASKAPLDVAVALGLIRPSPNGPVGGGNGYFDLFRNRLMFPILDLRGKVAGFGGRLLSGKTEGVDKEAPKYLNSPESLLFHKSKLAFGLFQAQKHIREADEVILVEGYFDVIALHRAGFQNTVATCGTSLSADHVKIFRRFAKRIILLFDGDRAGQTAMDRAMASALELGVVVYGAFLPEGLDPDELVLKGPEGIEQLRTLLAAAKPLLDLRIEEAIREASAGPEQRVQALRKIAGWLAGFRDPVGKEVRIEAVCRSLEIGRDLLEATLREIDGGRRPQGGGAGAPSAPGGGGERRIQIQQATTRVNPLPRESWIARPKRTGSAKLTPQEKLLLTALVHWPQVREIFSDFRERIPPEMTFSDLFEYPEARKLADSVFTPERIERGSLTLLVEAPQSLLEGVEDVQVRSTISEALVSADTDCSEAEVRRALHTRLSRAWARFSHRMQSELADAESRKDVALTEKLKKDYLDLQRKIKEFNTFYDKAE